MADDTPNDSAPDAEDMQEGTQEPVSGADGVTDGETPVAEAEAVREADTAVAVAEPESIPEPSASDLALAQINEEADRVQAALERWMEAKRRSDEAKEETKEAEADWKSAVTRQQQVIKGLREELPLFDRPYYEAKTKIAGVAAEVKAEKAQASSEAWRAVPLSHTTIPSNIVAILAESNYVTIGDIANLGNSGLPLTDIKGIGPSKAEKIETGLAEFWAKNTQYSRPAAKAKAATEPEPDDEPREDREVKFEAPADEFDPNSDSQSPQPGDEEFAPEPDEEDLEDDESEE